MDPKEIYKAPIRYATAIIALTVASPIILTSAIREGVKYYNRVSEAKRFVRESELKFIVR